MYDPAAPVVDAELVARRFGRVPEVREHDRAALPAELDGIEEEVRVVADLYGGAARGQAVRRRRAGVDAARDRIAGVLRARVAVLAVDLTTGRARAVAVAV